MTISVINQQHFWKGFKAPARLGFFGPQWTAAHISDLVLVGPATMGSPTVFGSYVTQLRSHLVACRTSAGPKVVSFFRIYFISLKNNDRPLKTAHTNFKSNNHQPSKTSKNKITLENPLKTMKK